MSQHTSRFCRFIYVKRKTYFPLRTIYFDYSAVLLQYITTFKAFSICKQVYTTADMFAKPLGVLSEMTEHANKQFSSAIVHLHLAVNIEFIHQMQSFLMTVHYI
jgi:hypothetical protein